MTTCIPAANSKPLMNNLEKIEELVTLSSSDANLKDIFSRQGIIDLLVQLITIVINLVLEIITIVQNILSLVAIIQSLISAVQLLFDLIGQLIDLITQLFNPEPLLG